MIEILKFTFSGFCTFVGMMILLVIVGWFVTWAIMFVGLCILAWRSKEDKEDKEDKPETR